MIRRLSKRGSDNGFTLTELMVTMVLLGILMSAVLVTTTRLYEATTDNTARTDSLQAAQLAMDNISKQVRIAIPLYVTPLVTSRFSEATASRVTLFAASGDEPAKVTFSVQTDGVLRQETVRADAGTLEPNSTFVNNTGYTSRTIARGVTNGSALFRYVLDTGPPVTAASTDLQRAQIVGVEVTVRVLTNANSDVPPAELVNTVYPFNPNR